MNLIFICSYCEQPIKFRPDQSGKQNQCPKCKNRVFVYENQATSILSKLSSNWMYERSNILGLFGSKLVGPISDTEFLGLVDRGEIFRDSIVKSSELTKDQSVTAAQVNFSLIRDMVSQRNAEEQRLRNLQSRESQRDAKNRDILLQGVRRAISDGVLTLNEKAQLTAFATKSRITIAEVEELIRKEARTLLDQLIEDSLSDGIVDNHENERIIKIANGLGVSLELTNDQQFRLTLAQYAWHLLQQLGCGGLPKAIAINDVEVFEVVSLKRPSGIPLGEGHYLRTVGTGVAKLDAKNFVVEGRLTAKKYARSSFLGAQRFSDGLFLKRSSGKSLFIRPEKLGLDWQKFAMCFEVLATDEPTLGSLTVESFIPAGSHELTVETRTAANIIKDEELDASNWSPSSQVPRFTFRVVGESYENRYLDLAQLALGEAVFLVREPRNAFDSNAVAVVNRDNKMLGYLKREVSTWFAPIMDNGRTFRCTVKQRTSSGGIIVAVFE
jgi:DNA-directed RNA polymerase subunit RPC12/RpoP